MERIGIGLITCNRRDFFRQSIASITDAFGYPDANHLMVVVNDGEPYPIETYLGAHHVIQHPHNIGVGGSKNDAFSWLKKQGCEHFFLIEDDIIVKDPNVFQQYIKTSKISGLEHLMYGYHGPANKVGVIPHPRLITMYSDTVGVALNRHCVGAFCYYTRNCLELCDGNDEHFLNAFEHVEHSLRIHKAGLTTPYWWFADIHNSYNYLDELACSEVNSTIRPRPDWQSNIQNAFVYFKQKHGVSPIEVPDSTQAEVIEFLKSLK